MSYSIDYRRCGFILELGKDTIATLANDMSVPDYLLNKPVFCFVEGGDSRTFDESGRKARDWNIQTYSCYTSDIVENACRDAIEICNGSLRLHGRSVSASGYVKAYENIAKCLKYLNASSLPNCVLFRTAAGWHEKDSDGLSEIRNSLVSSITRCKEVQENQVKSIEDIFAALENKTVFLRQRTLRAFYSKTPSFSWAIEIDFSDATEMEKELTLVWLVIQREFKFFLNREDSRISCFLDSVHGNRIPMFDDEITTLSA